MNALHFEHRNLISGQKIFKAQFLESFDANGEPSSSAIDNILSMSINGVKNYGQLFAASKVMPIEINPLNINYIELARRCNCKDWLGSTNIMSFLQLYSELTKSEGHSVRLTSNLVIFMIIERLFSSIVSKDSEYYRRKIIENLIQPNDYMDFYTPVGDDGLPLLSSIVFRIKLRHLNKAEFLHSLGETSESKGLEILSECIDMRHSNDAFEIKYRKIEKAIFLNLTYVKIAKIVIEIISKDLEEFAYYNLFTLYKIANIDQYEELDNGIACARIYDKSAIIIANPSGIDYGSYYPTDLPRAFSLGKANDKKNFIDDFNQKHISLHTSGKQIKFQSRMEFIWKEALLFCQTKLDG